MTDNPDMQHYSSSDDEVPEFTGGRNPKLLPGHKKKAWYRHIGFADWFWVIFLIGVVGFILVTNHIKNEAKCDDPKIKGNISMTTGEKIYHEPGDRFYNSTEINTNQGEKWFCTPKQAEAAGWRHSKR